MNMFFITKNSMPEGFGFKAFGPIHIIWLLAGLLLCVAACVLYKNLPCRKQKIMLSGLGICIFLLEMVKNLILILKCKKSVNWVIKSFDIKGNLKAIVSWLSISLF